LLWKPAQAGLDVDSFVKAIIKEEVDVSKRLFN
jgi:hypothetical protein